MQASCTRFRPLTCGKEPGILTPASPDSLPPLGDLIADEPLWRYPIGTAGEGAAHLRVWLTAGPEPGRLAVVTQTGSAASVTEAAGQIWAELARRYGPSLVLLEHRLAPEAGEGADPLEHGPHRRRRQPRTGWPCGRPPKTTPACRARTVDGGSRAPDRRQARELVQLVRASGRLI